MNHIDKHIVVNDIVIAVVEITGCIGNDRDHELEAFQKYCDELFEKKNFFIIFDIQLQHVNSKFLGLMVRIYEKCQREGGNLVLCNVSRYLMSNLTLLGLDKIFLIFPNCDDSVKYFVTNYL